jgi:hypothetical protein
MVEKAVTGWLKAGQGAIARSAMAEAVAQLRKGLNALSQVPEAAWRQQYELDLQVTMSRALMATRGFAAPEVGETCARVRQLCEQLKRPQFVPVLFGEWVHHFLRGELDQARAGAEELVQLSEQPNNAPLKVLGLRTLGLTKCSLGDLTGARDNLEYTVTHFDPAYDYLNPSNPHVVGQLSYSSGAQFGVLGDQCEFVGL